MTASRDLFGAFSARLFQAVRKARAVVKIPDDYRAPAEPLSVAPDDVRRPSRRQIPACQAAQSWLLATPITEVRLCSRKNFTLHDYPDVTSHACKHDKIAMPAVHGE